jgi:hypothetical protein
MIAAEVSAVPNRNAAAPGFGRDNHGGRSERLMSTNAMGRMRCSLPADSVAAVDGAERGLSSFRADGP